MAHSSTPTLPLFFFEEGFVEPAPAAPAAPAALPTPLLGSKEHWAQLPPLAKHLATGVRRLAFANFCRAGRRLKSYARLYQDPAVWCIIGHETTDVLAAKAAAKEYDQRGQFRQPQGNI